MCIRDSCCNLLADYPVKTKALANANMPPFGPGFDAENRAYDPAELCPNTDGYVERFVAIGIGPRYTEQDLKDIMAALDKVIGNMF